MKVDTPEMITMCLNCAKERCINCHDPTIKGTQCKSVIAYREDDDDMLFDSAEEAAGFFHCSVYTIRAAIYKERESQGYYWRYA